MSYYTRYYMEYKDHHHEHYRGWHIYGVGPNGKVQLTSAPITKQEAEKRLERIKDGQGN